TRTPTTKPPVVKLPSTGVGASAPATTGWLAPLGAVGAALLARLGLSADDRDSSDGPLPG
ncbi:MAG TPA: hypothetical protein VER37_07030, partial [Thermomicrobiales bacterium]|nr:hypothetical protein [Thermomicrobiales bacterium]